MERARYHCIHDSVSYSVSIKIGSDERKESRLRPGLKDEMGDIQCLSESDMIGV